MTATLVWFRHDLRLRDNDALCAAAERGEPVIPVYIWSPEEEAGWPPGAASRWWLHQSLTALEADLRKRDLQLTLRVGPALATLRALAAETGAGAVYWNRRYEPAARECSAVIKQTLQRDGIEVRSFNASLLVEPSGFLNQTGKPYQVYTPFMKQLLAHAAPAQPRGIPRSLRAAQRWPRSEPLEALELMPRVRWYETMARTWRPGENGALERFARFVDARLEDYAATRDQPAVPGTSGLSPHLHFGEIGPRQIWAAVGRLPQAGKFISELIWREFAYHLLVHFPYTVDQPLREEFAHFPWAERLEGLLEWQRGLTGVPMVDAGMRELWATGSMHNRVRMVAGSFLVKNLRIPWQEGARWFWDTLVDADLASNTLGWQWVAGSGADAAPYFRIFNPVLQGKRFDPTGEYVRRWIPELAQLDTAHVHAPWLADSAPTAYPAVIVDLEQTRAAALEAYQRMRAEVALPR